MNIETLKERLAKAEAKVEKKRATIEKKQVQIRKKKEKIISLGGTPDMDKYEGQKIHEDIYWLLCDIGSLESDIKRGEREIEETNVTIEKYRKQLAGELAKDDLLSSIPDNLKGMQDVLVERWDAYDKKRREALRTERNTLSYKEFMQKHSYADYEFTHKTDEEIHKENIREAKALILNLIYRVRDITGDITDWEHLSIAYNSVGPALTGYIEGKEGRCVVESILAGGYNIQRLHVRILTKPFN